MPTLANIQGSSLVADPSGLAGLVLQFAKFKSAQNLQLAEDEEFANILNPEAPAAVAPVITGQDTAGSQGQDSAVPTGNKLAALEFLVESQLGRGQQQQGSLSQLGDTQTLAPDFGADLQASPLQQVAPATVQPQQIPAASVQPQQAQTARPAATRNRGALTPGQKKSLLKLSRTNPQRARLGFDIVKENNTQMIESQKRDADRLGKMARRAKMIKDPVKRAQFIRQQAEREVQLGNDVQPLLDFINKSPAEQEAFLDSTISDARTFSDVMGASLKAPVIQERKEGSDIITSSTDVSTGVTTDIATSPRFEAPEAVQLADELRLKGAERDKFIREHALRPTTNIRFDRTGPGAFLKTLGEKLGTDFVDRRNVALDAADLLRGNEEAFNLLDQGIITGFGANFKLGAGKLLQQAGINFNQDAIANTEAFAANQGKQVAKIIKAFGAGTGLSDADREFAIKIAGGSIELTEDSIRRILEINNRASKNIINRFNRDAATIDPDKTVPFPLTIAMPELAERFRPPPGEEGSTFTGGKTQDGFPIFRRPDGSTFGMRP